MKKNILLCFLTVALCLSLLSCAASKQWRVGDTSVSFLSERELKKLEKPLVKLLANERALYGTRGEIEGYRAADPASPSISKGHSAGLFDITGDGTPELLIFPYGGGGSSGLEYYEIYDVLSGEQLGDVTGNGGSWCHWLDREGERLIPLAEIWSRCGWSGRGQAYATLRYDAEGDQWESEELMSVSYLIDMERKETNGEIEVLGEIYPSTSYYLNGEKTSLDQFHRARLQLFEPLVCLPETRLTMLWWSDVCSEEEDAATRAEKMAEALLSSGQKFPRPIK